MALFIQPFGNCPGKVLSSDHVCVLSGEGELADVKPMSEMMLRNAEDVSQRLSKCLHPVLLTITDTIRETRVQLISVESFIKPNIHEIWAAAMGYPEGFSVGQESPLAHGWVILCWSRITDFFSQFSSFVNIWQANIKTIAWTFFLQPSVGAQASPL